MVILANGSVIKVQQPNPDEARTIKIAPYASGGGGHYTHSQSTPSASWVIHHNLGVVRVPVVVLDSDPTEAVYTDMTVVDLNTINLSFDSAVSGKAYL